MAGSQGPEQSSGRFGHWLPSCQPCGRISVGASEGTSSVGSAGEAVGVGSATDSRASSWYQPPAAPATRATLTATAVSARHGRASSQAERRIGASTTRVSAQASSTEPVSTARPSSSPARSWPLWCSHITRIGQCTR